MGCDIHAFFEIKIKGNWEFLLNFDDFYRKNYFYRDYEVFAFLADVRNRYGIIPISQPRGFPNDASCDPYSIFKHYRDDLHSTSHILLKEIFDIKDQWFYKTCGVTPEQFSIFLDVGRPIEYFHYASTPQVSPSEMAEICRVDPKKDCWTKIGWRESIKDHFDEWFKDAKTKLEPLGPLEDMRMIFGFNN